MEEEIIIKSHDGSNIYGTLLSPNTETNNLVIFVHGFLEDRNHHMFFNAAKFFKIKGFASFRFDLYSSEEGGRIFTDCSISTHLEDLRSVYNNFKTKFDKIFLVGHSLGGIVVLESGIKASAITLWDSSYKSSGLSSSYKYNDSLGAYILEWGLVYVVGKKMYEEKLVYPSPESMISKVFSPIKIICAGNSNLVEGGKDYYRIAKEPKAFAVIEGAGHFFHEEGTEEKLLQETYDWFAKKQ